MQEHTPTPQGTFHVEINRERCEGKSTCAAVCPNEVFEVSRIADDDFAELSFLGRLKSRAHKRKTAYAVREQDCAGCMKCVSACPEHAISVKPVGGE